MTLEAIAVMGYCRWRCKLFGVCCNPLFSDTQFARQMLTMCILFPLTVLVVLYARLRKESLTVFPKPFSKGYVIATCIVLGLYIATSANYPVGMTAILVLIYGSIITPLYEVMLFRGYLWNRFAKTGARPWQVAAWDVAMFTLWHVGYMYTNMLEGNWSSVLWKCAAGLGYGIVLSLLRLKAKNCYATMLLHGAMNLFMVCS